MVSALLTAAAVIGFVALTLGTAVFVAAEFSLTALEKPAISADVRDRGDRRSRQVQHAHGTLSFQLSGAQLGITITTLITGYIAEPVLAKFLRPVLEWMSLPSGAVAALTLILALVIATSLSMVLGELAPKNLAIARPLATARATAGMQAAFSAVFRWAITFLNSSANSLVRRLGMEPAEELSSARSAQELEALVRNSAAHGSIDATTAELVGRSLTFGSRTAEDIMTPRQRVRTLEVGDTVDDLMALSIETGFSRFPVVDGDLDDTLGFVHVKEALKVPPASRAHTTMRVLCGPAPVVPASLDGDSLMDQLRANGLQVALVVDEYGGSAGIVTVEDLIEEIVGDVRDEHDDEMADVQTTDGGYLCSGLLRIDEVEDSTGYRAPEGDYDTLGGLVMYLLGRIPDVGDTVELPEHAVDAEGGQDAAPWVARVARMDGRRVDLVELARAQAEGPPRPAEEGADG
ncbi:hemolysin family protein [Tsukamurella sp. 8F]|uniref:hemolysin family protein n=1 Tax=unclassified Tsukamurella TaxID=2633480 RepID=UPI0023BA1E8F|nr:MULTISPECIES: hemolysin family protein [unclassified Tsukamurella]MDF0529106.1 hemolysin family protein [Tsukamurella sp. 8J]MDF0588144.1 hemolysin family protein [Tsukamurella sp. 8F]